LVGLISVRFYPWGAHHFFEKPIKDCFDSTVTLEEIWKENYKAIFKNYWNNSKNFFNNYPISKSMQQFERFLKLSMTQQLAIDMGYFDQAHFNKDFKSFSGLTPRDFFDKII
jgi:YesN/AraC family two-component response regulator